MIEDLLIRKYVPGDESIVLSLMESNTPDYFHPEETADLVGYLRNEIESYFVVEKEGRVIASGGYNWFPESDCARISWDLVHPSFHGKGIGSLLTHFRIQQIQKNLPAREIQVRTTQHTYKFYEKLGFDLVDVTPDYWAKGFDLYDMRIKL